MTLRFGLVAVWLIVGSCSLLSPPRANVEKAILNQIPLDLPHQESHGVSVLVLPPETAPVYDTVQMAYTSKSHEVAYYREREWGETPSQMLHPLLVKTLENTHSFSAVLVPPYAGRYTYALRTQILELIQDFTSESAMVVLSLRVRLTGFGKDQTVATREISLSEPLHQRTSDAGVVAANTATAKALQETAEFVLEKTAAGRQSTSP
jgi:cholesterol transport system auxiliary component